MHFYRRFIPWHESHALLAATCVLVGQGLFVAPVYALQRNQSATAASEMRVFHGAWFAVRYPANFSASTASKSSTSVTGSDEATFTSPDGHVQFHVFSPQWNGKPSFTVVAPGEKIVSQSGESRKDASKTYTTKVKWVTVEAKNKTYTRTWEDLETTLNTRRVVGVKYKTEADFKKYRPQYLAFKKSLQQFGD